GVRGGVGCGARAVIDREKEQPAIIEVAMIEAMGFVPQIPLVTAAADPRVSEDFITPIARADFAGEVNSRLHHNFSGSESLRSVLACGTPSRDVLPTTLNAGTGTKPIRLSLC